jgi:protein TonB
MLSGRQSFLVSLSFHLGLLVVLLVAGALVAHKLGKRKPIELDLLPPVPARPQQEQGAPQPQEEPEPDITPHVIEDPSFNPNASLDLDDVPEVKEETYKEWEPKPVLPDDGGPVDPAASYGQLIVAACKRNWTPPPPGVLGRPLPTTDVNITVARTGQILDYTIVRASGNAAFDRSVLEAIRLSNPLPAFPRELSGAQDTFPVTFELDD